ncbi:MAG TPA: hypothetical protein VEK07_25220 [Polyangiaceae bacterium]|nr:hypothetical protein [Polyangiaceae bacterium]
MRGKRPLALAAALFGLGGCTGNAGMAGESCVVTDPMPQCGDAGLVGYACSGTARPDEEQSRSIDGVPQGIICTDEGPLDDAGTSGFCCSPATTSCVFDPVAGCAAPTYGYECLGGYDRPEAFDPTVSCGEGLVQGNFIIYCCGAQAPSHGCQQATSATCPETLVPWTCTDETLPSEAELGSNQSRADYNLLVCDVPTVVQQGSTQTINYCCFTPTLVPPGASCLFDTTVPGCAPGSFGFACTGPDTPAQDYPAVTCADSGASGVNPQGYQATLYCCQYQ